MNSEKIKNRGTGAGGSKTNATGLKFENEDYLYDWLKNSGYILNCLNEKSSSRAKLYEIIEDNNIIGYYGRQGKVYDALSIIDKKFSNEYIKNVLSSKINPDGFILSLKPKRLTIFEKKWQQSSGSVDEKIQTAPFKLEMFEKLLRNSGISCMYQYILSEWFRDKKYRNVKECYHENKKIKIWVENENLHELNIEDYLKFTN